MLVAVDTIEASIEGSYRIQHLRLEGPKLTPVQLPGEELLKQAKGCIGSGANSLQSDVSPLSLFGEDSEGVTDV